MRDDEIRKLLGGYATNTLTGDERRALFEAALDDQQLFDALQDEQALKQLLSDPASRQAIQSALNEAIAEPSRSSWWTQKWLWAGGAAGAVAAAALIIGVVQHQPPAAKSGRVEIASNRQASGGEREVAPESKPAEEKSQPPLNSRQFQRPRLKSFARDNLTSRAGDRNALATAPAEAPAAAQATAGELNQPAGGVGGVVGGALAAPRVNGLLDKSTQPLRYALLRKDAQGLYTLIPSGEGLKPGDSVRLSVSAASSGYLSLDQLLPSGEWKRVFPESPQGRLVAANTDVTMPDVGVEVQNGAVKFRISLIAGGAAPQAKFAKQALRASGAREANDSAGSKDTKDINDSEPITLDVTIGPGELP